MNQRVHRLVLAGLLTGIPVAQADVSITRGATDIPDGEALAEEDLTVANDRLAFAIAVESRPPWGAARHPGGPGRREGGRGRPGSHRLRRFHPQQLVLLAQRWQAEVEVVEDSRASRGAHPSQLPMPG
ncbi:hypothetical protein DSL92_07785 [Billgrantia gudaonensis]|uniref:Uncharacterized protein n=1 Tax=Billgrantia gudaonensis TaxID=376427 RepID=A0A432JGN3_9GAMM|nr:hypothetical protein DSL92_07785 [Halomonas gudaonensis]